MSKTDELRAMREAKYARAAAARAGQPQARPKPVPVAPEPATTKKTAKAAPEAQPEADGLCGHRSMNGRTCTREAGHAAKSHRYS
jgi:uncharacterized protein involved in copper resistance